MVADSTSRRLCALYAARPKGIPFGPTSMMAWGSVVGLTHLKQRNFA